MTPTPTPQKDGAKVALPLDLRRPAADGAGRRRSIRPALVAVPLIGAAFVAGAVFAMIREPSVPTDLADLLSRSPASTTQEAAGLSDARPVQPVLGLARLMPEGDIIRVSPPFGAGDARIAAILVAEGDRVAEGEVLVTLDNAAALDSARLAAEAAVVQREAALVQAREGVRIGLLEAQASLGEARAAAEAAQSRLDRARALTERGVTATATLDDLEAAALQAAQGLARAEATVARWDTGTVETQPDVVVAQAALAAIRIDLQRAIRDLAKAEVRAPVAGVVLEIEARPGERPGTDGLISLGRTDRMMALVEVFQTEIGRVREGQEVRLTATPLAKPLSGRVERIGLLVGRQNLVSDDTAANTDARVVEVLVRLEPESSARAADLSNLEAVARIDIGGAE